jgi:predicted transcriptional regulator YheO
MDIIIIFFIDICFSTRAQNNIQLLCININKTIIENMKIWILFLINRRSNSIWFNQLTNLKDFISHTCVFVLILNNLYTTPGFHF